MAEVLAAPDAARLTDFARAFKAAARAVVLYPDAHPAIATTLGRLTQLTTPPLLTAPLRIGVTTDTLLIGDSAPARPDAAISELAALLHSHLIGAITVRPDGDQAAWRNFLLLLGRAPDAVRSEGGIARIWSSMPWRHVELREIDYAEVLRERAGGSAASWPQVVASCLAGDGFEVPEELLTTLLEGTANSDVLGEVFRELDAAVAETGGGVGARGAALVRLLRGIVSALNARAPERAESVMRDLAIALGKASPDLLLSVLAQGREREPGASSVVSSVMSRMPDGTIASFVATHAVDAGAPIERVAQAFQALVVDGARRERLVAMAHDTAIVSGAEGEEFEQSWQAVAEKLLSQYSDEPFVPEHYARELTSVQAQAVELEHLYDDPPERLAAWLGTVATSELRQLDLTLVLDLLRLEQEPARREALMTPVVSLVEDLFLVGDFEAADPVLAALRSDAEQVDVPATRTIALDAIGRLVTPATVRQILEHAAAVDEAQFQYLKTTCRSLGETIVWPLAEALAAQDRTRTRERLTEILIGFEAVGRREVEQLKTSSNPAVRRTAVYLLRKFGGSDALPELTELLDDDEPVVQREAVRAILKIGSDEGYRILEQALAGGTQQSREAIVQALSSTRDDRAAPLLVYILEHVSHSGELGWVYARALDLLGQLRDPQAIPALQAALYRGEWWAPRRTASLRRSAAAALARIGSDEAVAVLVEASRKGSRGVRSAARAELDAAALGRAAEGRD
jgi:hypothetical protein